MKYKLSFIFLTFMLLFFSSAYAEFTQHSDSLGLVIMPAEDYDAYRAGLGSKDGETFTLEDSIAGYLGDGYMQANMAAGDGNASHADTIGIKLTYEVTFVIADTHYVWARAYYNDGQSDSFFWGSDSGVNGQCARGSDWRYGEWYWYRADSSIVVDAPGIHTINFYGREPNARLDHIIVTSSATFNPNTDWNPKEIVFVSKSSVVDDTGEQADKVFIDDLEAEGYIVNKVYSTALETASQDIIDALNNADLVIIGRSGGSSDFGPPHKAAWNAITSPVMNIHPWTARNSRLNWLPTGTTTSYDTGGDTISAKIELPDDPVFADATMAEDSTMDWVTTPYDYMGTTNGGNGTVLARSASDANVFFVRWDPWVEFYNGAGDYAAGYRTLIGNGNDHAYATAGGPWNYYNFTDEAKQVYLKEVARMVELPEPPEKPRGLGKEIVFVSKSSVVDDTGEQADKVFIDDLEAEKYVVITVYSTALETASQGLIDTLNNADLVIIGRSGGSSDFGNPHKDAWNAITSPVMNIHPWTARNSRLNWLPTGTTTSYDTGGDTISAKIELPDDPVFADATMAADSTMDWVSTPYDYMETTNGGNGTVLVRDASSSNVFFVRWDPWVEFYNGAGDYAAGYRTLIGNGNDHAYASAGGTWNYYNFTDEAKEVYLKEVARMTELPEPPEKPRGLDKEIVFVSKSSVLDDTGEQADKPFIDDLLAEKYEVITVYSTALETASQGFIDTLNNADLVIIGRSGGSSDFGDPHKDAWNAITSPVMNIHPWTARNSRLNWLPTGTTTSYDTGGDTISAKIELPDDPVFADATMAEDSTMDWVYTPYDYMETTNGGNGTVLARDASSSNVFFVRWDPWVEFYDGADDYAAGYRTLIGNGNDHAYATAGGPWNYYNFTDEAKEVYLKEVARMIELPEPPEKPAELSGTLVELVNPSFEEPGTETKDWTAIPGWNLDQAAQNSGVSPNGLATDGSCAAWLRSDDGELWNLTDYTIQAGDVFALKADVRNSWQATSFDLRLYYDDNGTRVTVATTTGTFTGDSEPALSEYTVRFVANTVEAAIGKTLGISIHNTTSEADKYIEMDNFRLYRDNPTGIADKHNIIDKFVLYQNYPNPFNPQTSIKFSLVKAGRTTLKIYNTLGQLVATLVDKKMQAGVYTVSFNAASLSSGMYLYRIESGDFIQVKKMLLLK